MKSLIQRSEIKRSSLGWISPPRRIREEAALMPRGFLSRGALLLIAIAFCPTTLLAQQPIPSLPEARAAFQTGDYATALAESIIELAASCAPAAMPAALSLALSAA